MPVDSNILMTALASAPNGIVVTDRRGTILWVNQAFTSMTGYTADEAIGQNHRILSSGEHPPAFYQALWSTILAGRTWIGEIIDRRKDGVLYVVEETIAPVTNTAGEITHFVGIQQDITASQRAHEARREIEQRFRDLVENTSDWIWEVDADMRYVYASSKVKELLGYTPEEVLGKTPADLMPAAEVERLKSDLGQLLHRPGPFARLENANLH